MPKPKPTVVKTLAEVESQIGVGERTLARNIAKGCPGKPGAYDVAAIKAWRTIHVKPRPGVYSDDTAAPAGTMAELHRRRLKAQTELEELALAQKRGELVEVKQAKMIMGQHIAEVRAHLEQLPEFAASVAPKMDVKARRQFLDRMKAKIRQTIEGFQRGAREMAAAAERKSA